MLKKLILLTALVAPIGMLVQTGSAQAAEDSFLFGAPQKDQIFGSIGYSGTPRIGYMTGISPTVAVGGEFILDIGLFNNIGDGFPGTLTIAGGLPVKILLGEDDKLSYALTLEPGIGINILSFGPFSTERFALLLHSGFNMGYKVSRQVTIGGGVDFPLTFFLGDVTNIAIPLLFGPAAEFNLAPDLSLRSELKLGPHILAGDGFTPTNLAFKFNVGVNYRF